MKLSIASSAILLRTFVVGEEATITKTALSSLSSNNKHDQDLTKRRQRRFLDNNNNQRLLLRKQQDQHHPTIPSSTISPRLRSSASADFDANYNRKRNGKSGALQNTTSVIQHHSLRQGDEWSVRECLPRQTTETIMDSVADVGILGCGMGEYCMESLDATTLGGKCINVKIEDDDVSSHSRQPSQLSRIQRPLLAFIQNRHAGEECDPSVDPSLTPCEPHQHCVQNDANGGSCVPLSYDSSNKVWSRLRNLQQSTYSYSTFFDFIQYSCYYETDPLVCECTTDPASGTTAINCENTPPCENRTSPCAGDYSELQYCNQMTIQAQGTSVNDFDFQLCYGYLSPVDMIYCYQIVSKENLLTCNMLMNDEQCTSCELDADDICIEFDCRNTPSGRKGNLCEHNAMGNPAFLDLLDCSGACNICGEGNKLENYDFNLQPILSNTLDCYSPLFCDDDLWTCQQLQEVALVGVPIGGDSCKVAPSVDLFPLCCVEAPPDVPPPPEDKPGTVPCEALDHDCFSCIENEDCFWCPGDAICSSSPIFVDTINVFDRESSCNSPEDFVTETCTEAGNFFSDPLYSAQKWIFDMIKVQEVWAKGYTGNGIHVRVNDEGIESSHPEFENRIDKDASCPSEVEPISSAYENGFSHGTAVASILGGAAGNDVCGVGIAPNVTMSSCHFNSNKDFTDLFVYKLTTFDISQNSWGRDTCVDLDGRRLQGPQCPFTFEQSHAFPCEVCDFSNLLLGSCIDAIESHCRYYFREDRLGCLEHLDLTLGGNCDFQSLTDENRDAFARGVTEGRDGKGVIFVFASGNSLHIGANTNFEGFGTNTRMAMAVGAVGKDGIVTTYSTEGSSLFVSAPGGDITNSVSNMVSANINGGCTDSGQGTSFAAPIVSGVVAMMLEANNELTYRDVQAIIASTSQPVEDELDNTAGINGAGRYHSNFYGFGIINAIAAVEAAENWELVGNETMVQAQSDTLNKLIPDDETKTIEETLEVTSLNPFTIESVYLYLKLEHSSRGHLQIKLTSPSGTESILTPGSRPENTQQADSQWWKLLSWKFWGEIPDGEWKISIADLKEGDATFEGSCADFEWSFLDRVTCDVLERVQYCEGGQVDPYHIAQINGEGTIIFSHPYQELTAGEACCACGGGVEISELSDSLLEWKLVIYGEGSSDAEPFTSSPTISPSNLPSLAPSMGIDSPISFPSAAPLPDSLSPTNGEDEIPRVEANGDTYFYRNTLLQKTQPIPTEEMMLVRNGKDLQADAFSLISFPYQGLLGLGIDDITSQSSEGKTVQAEICLNHVQRPDGGNSSTYTLCRLKPDSWKVADGDGSNLETYQGVDLADLMMPDDCMDGNKSALKTFEVFPNDTTSCVEISDLLSVGNSPVDRRQDLPSIVESNKDIIMFMLDSLDQDQDFGDQFYTVNSDKPPLLIFYPAPTESPTIDNTPPPLETSLPTPIPTPAPTENTNTERKGLYGLLALLLLCPILCLCLIRQKRGKTVGKETSDGDEQGNSSFETAPTVAAEVEFLHPQAPPYNSEFVYPSPPFQDVTNERIQGRSSDGDESSSSSNTEEETNGGWESGDGHSTYYENGNSSSSSSSSSGSNSGDNSTNADTFEDETSESLDDDTSDL